MIGRLCQVFISGDVLGGVFASGRVRCVHMYDDVGMMCQQLFHGDIVVPLAREGAWSYYILTQHGVGRLEDEFIRELE